MFDYFDQESEALASFDAQPVAHRYNREVFRCAVVLITYAHDRTGARGEESNSKVVASAP
jgi:hypothetical protein